MPRIYDDTPAELRRDPAGDLRFAAMRCAIAISDCREEGRPIPQPVTDAEMALRAAVVAYDEAVRA